ncbi:MAG: DUF4258 domain-containing protein [Candidatus Binatia bacterium]
MYPRILAKIRALVKRGDYILSIHAENELADDKLNEQDLEAAILKGTITRRERDPIGRAKYVIEGQTLGRKALTAVVQVSNASTSGYYYCL